LDDVVVTPKKLRWGFAALIAGNGYVVFPTWLGGLIIQWGTAGAIPAGGSLTVVRPLTFPNAGYLTVVGNSFSQGSTSYFSSVGVQYVNNAQFNIYVYGSVGQPNATWISIGH
jgi:hypothetical protein